MRIRAATADDLDVMVRMAARFLTETEYVGRLAVNEAQIRRFGERCLGGTLGGDSAILVAEEGGAVIGMIGLLVSEHPFSGERVAGELFWWVEPERRGHGARLMRAGERWAAAHRATRIQMIAPNDRVATLYARRGYARLETTFQRSLSCRPE